MQNLNTTDFIKTVNNLRLTNKDNWYTWQGKALLTIKQCA